MASDEHRSSRLRKHSGLIAAVGALVVFTSWAVSSTLGQRYARETTSIVTAANDEQLLGHLSDLRQMQERLVSISLQVRADLRASHQISDGLTDRFPVLLAYYSTRSLASQLRELRLHCQSQLAYARATGASSGALEEVESSASTLLATLTERERLIDEHLSSSTVDLARLKNDVDEYTELFRQQVAPRLKPMFATVASASTASFEFGKQRLQSVQRAADQTSTAALILYALGSVLVIGGKFMEFYKE